jgi:hypothetical protein
MRCGKGYVFLLGAFLAFGGFQQFGNFQRHLLLSLNLSLFYHHQNNYREFI